MFHPLSRIPLVVRYLPQADIGVFCHAYPICLFLCFDGCCVPIYLSGCGIYSFSGAAIDPRVKTLSVSDFQLLASNAPPILLPTFGAAQKQIYVRSPLRPQKR
ncbi:MAG: hypothetical protein IPL33_11430 [Sphingobacteriales bacterium]|nr:hypothetical protein [Sphingobacteriales bacterium]